MDWIQTLTIIATMVGGVFAFYQITRDRINRMEEFHREDMNKLSEALVKMDEKWERLFERLLIKENK